MSRALVALGANLGDRESALAAATSRLAEIPGGKLLSVSCWRPTRAVGGPAGQDDFLNGAALLETSLDPHTLLGELQTIEQALGRQRGQRWAPRTIDLDLLLHDQAVSRDPRLELPHPGLAFRRFMLEPAAEVAGDMLHPRIGRTLDELVEHLNLAPPYVAILAADRARGQEFARRLAQATGALLLADDHESAARGAPAEHLRRLDGWRQKLSGIVTDEDSEAEERLWVSDFWWPAFPSLVGSAADAQRDTLLADWESESPRVPQAKLLLLLATEDELQPEREKAPKPQSLDGADSPRIARREFVRAVLDAPRHGPFLHCDPQIEPDAASDSLDAALRIALAAIEAVR